MTFRRLPTEIDGVVFVEPDVHGDERGFLVETFRAEAMKLVGIDVDFVRRTTAGPPCCGPRQRERAIPRSRAHSPWRKASSLPPR